MTLNLGFQPRLRALLLAAIVAGVLAGVYFTAKTSRLDHSPLPRPWFNAPFVRTPEEIVDRMLALAAPRAEETLYDLGCGDGRIVVRAAETRGCHAIGFDLDPERVEEARERVRRNGLEALVTVVEQDIFTISLAEADVVTLYLLPRLNARLVPQLERLKRGARIVSHDFDLPGFVPDRVVMVASSDRQADHVLYLWTAPLRAAD